jgi:hypothetical protein
MFGIFSTKGFKDYVREARQVLQGNWTDSYAKPSPSLYPHQWNWDPGFIAIGNAHHDQEKAGTERRSLFAHQWPNGMVPQIVFNPEALGHYFPEPDFWQAPEGRPTSGITMAPIHATACLHIYEKSKGGSDAKEFLRFNLYRNNGLPKPFLIVGCGCTKMTDETFRDSMKEALVQNSRIDQGEWEAFVGSMFYRPIQYDDPSSYADLEQAVHRPCECHGRGNPRCGT